MTQPVKVLYYNWVDEQLWHENQTLAEEIIRNREFVWVGDDRMRVVECLSVWRPPEDHARKFFGWCSGAGVFVIARMLCVPDTSSA